GADLERVIGPTVDDVDGIKAVVLPQVPAAVTALLVHAREDAAADTQLAGTHPGAVAERFVLLEVAHLAEVKGTARLHHRRRTDLAIGLPAHLAGGAEGLWRTADPGHLAARALVE